MGIWEGHIDTWEITFKLWSPVKHQLKSRAGDGMQCWDVDDAVTAAYSLIPKPFGLG